MNEHKPNGTVTRFSTHLAVRVDLFLYMKLSFLLSAHYTLLTFKSA